MAASRFPLEKSRPGLTEDKGPTRGGTESGMKTGPCIPQCRAALSRPATGAEGGGGGTLGKVGGRNSRFFSRRVETTRSGGSLMGAQVAVFPPPGRIVQNGGRHKKNLVTGGLHGTVGSARGGIRSPAGLQTMTDRGDPRHLTCPGSASLATLCDPLGRRFPFWFSAPGDRLPPSCPGGYKPATPFPRRRGRDERRPG